MTLEWLIEQCKAVTMALAEATGFKVPPNLSAHEWSTAENLVAGLEPFLDITILMSLAWYPTMSMILPIVDGLKDYLQHTKGGLDGLLQKIFLQQLEVQFGDVFTDAALCIVTLVDPRFKAIRFGTENQ